MAFHMKQIGCHANLSFVISVTFTIYIKVDCRKWIATEKWHVIGSFVWCDWKKEMINYFIIGNYLNDRISIE